ncbi:uncharacterized protein PHACADRAFT_260260 [Phanerochaete carnosa HHB-10118-sp]|uniref:Uncharacterized protein n=1 Tax=Phanerochaete carnosa (strain HHB-10118-sp) TaxID=650164 RepID=K5UUS8_PHACS|nr:uncharacterized protein PHACADRAFT_260260 [Phanerochaete carnosa HHB-10118-sp]EKM53766.1 hypothetical protein PHACADRAFT_260260 [Phanerochaete carnosa HHB-10118-sp]
MSKGTLHRWNPACRKLYSPVCRPSDHQLLQGGPDTAQQIGDLLHCSWGTCRRTTQKR